MSDSILQIKDLCVEYKSKKGILDEDEIVHAVNGVSVDINEGEILAVAGESGCGKSTLAKAIIRLVDSKSGEIVFNGEDILKTKDLCRFRKNVQMIFQNPYASLNPKMKILDILREPLQINSNLSSEEIDKKVEGIVEKVELSKSCLNLYPHEFSGGQRQRIAIARALILNPKIILADEPVSALDVSIQAQIIKLLKELKEFYNLTVLFISHDLNVINYISDRVAIMYLGEVIEFGTKEEIFNNPVHPYTKALLSAAPKLNDHSEKIILKGDLPSVTNLPQGCKFHTRCPYAMSVCKTDIPSKTDISQSHYVKCFLYSENL